jgi:hypothetical protein
MDQPKNKTLFELHEEENKHTHTDRKNLIIGVIIFILMLPVDYIIIKEVSDYRKEKARQKEVVVPVFHNERARLNEADSRTTAEPTVTTNNEAVQAAPIKRTADGWLEVDGKRYVIDGRTIIKTK